MRIFPSNLSRNADTNILSNVIGTLTISDPASSPASLSDLKSLKNSFAGTDFVYSGVKGTSKELAESRSGSFDWISNITTLSGKKHAVITDLSIDSLNTETLTSGLNSSDYLFTVTGVKGNASPFIASPTNNDKALSYQSSINPGDSLNYTSLPEALTAGNYTVTAIGFANTENPTSGNLDHYDISKLNVKTPISLTINFYAGEQLSHINVSGSDLSDATEYSYLQTAGQDTKSIEDDIWTLNLTVEAGKPAKTASVSNNAGKKGLGVMVNAVSADKVGSDDDYGGAIFRTNAWWNDITLLSDKYKFSDISPGIRVDGTNQEEVDFDFYFSKDYLERAFDVDLDSIDGGFIGTGLSSVNAENKKDGTYIDVSKPGAISALGLPVSITDASATKADGSTDFYRVSFTNDSWSQANISLAFGPRFKYNKDNRAVLKGTCENQVLRGGKGKDIFYGRCGLDTIIGGQSQDILNGGKGRDFLKGKKGKDYLTGGRNKDLLRGGRNQDDLFGRRGRDTLIGGRGQDTLNGGAGIDLIHGKQGKDLLKGGRNRDLLRGGRDQDALHGRRGSDFIVGGPGRDTLNGGRGKDTLNGGGGADHFELSSGTDIIKGFTADGDTIKAPANVKVQTTQQGNDLLLISLDENINTTLKNFYLDNLI